MLAGLTKHPHKTIHPSDRIETYHQRTIHSTHIPRIGFLDEPDRYTLVVNEVALMGVVDIVVVVVEFVVQGGRTRIRACHLAGGLKRPDTALLSDMRLASAHKV